MKKIQKAIIIAADNNALPGLEDLNTALESGWRVAHMATIDLPATMDLPDSKPSNGNLSNGKPSDKNGKNLSLGVLLILEREDENHAYHDMRMMSGSKESNC